MNAQEDLWRGLFGDKYTERNPANPANDREFFRNALAMAELPADSTVLELGANTGRNLLALRRVLETPYLGGVEINDSAFRELSLNADEPHFCSVLTFEPEHTWELVFTKGLLIHIHPRDLGKVYATLFDSARRYILIAEYFNPNPVMQSYRGQKDALWKRDFAGDMLDLYPTLWCVDYGFVWSRDAYPQDNITWFLLEKPV